MAVSTNPRGSCKSISEEEEKEKEEEKVQKEDR